MWYKIIPERLSAVASIPGCVITTVGRISTKTAALWTLRGKFHLAPVFQLHDIPARKVSLCSSCTIPACEACCFCACAELENGHEEWVLLFFVVNTSTCILQLNYTLRAYLLDVVMQLRPSMCDRSTPLFRSYHFLHGIVFLLLTVRARQISSLSFMFASSLTLHFLALKLLKH